MGELQEEAVAPLARERRPEGYTWPGSFFRLGVDMEKGEVAFAQGHEVPQRPELGLQVLHGTPVPRDVERERRLAAGYDV